ncbi:MAG TPA: hypothetical protein VE083_03785 [Terriglobales bacterium]|nr:hypothetical protein [Terriglobales bacterium]
MSLWLRRASEVTVISLALGVVCIPRATGQVNLPKYDLTTETKMKGTVQELKLPEKGSEKEGARFTLKSGDNTLDVYLCPKSFLDDMGSSLAKGDEVSLTGSKVKQDGADLILAREVVKGTDTLVLRDDKGKPVWNWHK